MASARKQLLERMKREEGKKKKDYEVTEGKRIQEEMKPKTLEEKGMDVADKQGMKEDDVWMIMGRQFAEQFFVNNREAQQDAALKALQSEEGKRVIGDIIEERMMNVMQRMMTGFFSVHAQAPEWPIVKEEIPVVEEVAVAIEVPVEEPLVPVRKRRKSRHQAGGWNEESWGQLVREAQEQGIDPRVGSRMVKLGGHFITGYNAFMNHHKGIKGAWKAFVNQTLNQ